MTYSPIRRASSRCRLLTSQSKEEVGIIAILLGRLVPVLCNEALHVKALEGFQSIVLIHRNSSRGGQLGAAPTGSEAADRGDEGSGGLGRESGDGGGGLALTCRTWGGQRRLVRNPVLGGILSV